MNATTILSTTKMYIHSAFTNIRGLLFFVVILVLSSWCMSTGPGAHILAYSSRPAPAAESAVYPGSHREKSKFSCKNEHSRIFPKNTWVVQLGALSTVVVFIWLRLPYLVRKI